MNCISASDYCVQHNDLTDAVPDLPVDVVPNRRAPVRMLFAETYVFFYKYYYFTFTMYPQRLKTHIYMYIYVFYDNIIQTTDVTVYKSI